MKCSDCKFVNEYAPRRLECRRYPPRLIWVGGDASEIDSSSDYPSVASESWCGEFVQVTENQNSRVLGDE